MEQMDLDLKLEEMSTDLPRAFTMAELVRASHLLARKKGWYDSPHSRNVGEMLALVHSEISEALEALRVTGTDDYVAEATGKPEGFGVELADAILRIADLCGHLGVDLEGAIVRKHAYNQGRPYRHGGKAL